MCLAFITGPGGKGVKRNLRTLIELGSGCAAESPLSPISCGYFYEHISFFTYRSSPL